MEIVGATVFCDASLDGDKWFEVASVEFGDVSGLPLAVRLGKTSRTGGDDDFGTPGEDGVCRVSDFYACGGLNKEAITRRSSALSRLKGLTVSVHYEMYDGIPLLCKWLTIRNGSNESVRLNNFTNEILALVEYESEVDNYTQWKTPDIHIESDYEFAGMSANVANRTTLWLRDTDYLTQVSYERRIHVCWSQSCLSGLKFDIEPGGTFESFRTFELAFDSTERERKGLAVRRMYRTIAPWVTENPIMMHVRRAEPEAVRLAIDQCAQVGFEMVILTFGSGFNLENEDPKYIAELKELADYAHSKGY